MNKDTIGIESAPTLPMVVGVDLGGTQIRAAVLRGATLISRVGLLTGENPTPDRIIPRIFQAVERVLREADARPDEIAGIGIGAPGPLDNRTGVVFAPPNLPGWENVPLGELFRQEFHVPIFVENDANAAALGEYMFGAGKGCREMVYLTISTGIGGGIISHGKILEGTSGTAAELGHMTVDWRGDRCNCGNIGCLERIASGTAIALRAKEAIALGQADELLAFAHSHPARDLSASTPADHALSSGDPALHVNARTVAEAAQAGVELAREIIATAAEALGIGLVNIIHIFNPERIILGGGLTKMGDMLLEPALRIVQERAMRVPRTAVSIVPAELDAEAGLVGVGALIYYNREGGTR